MADTYKPNPRYYDDQIADIQKDIEKFSFASYSSSKRGYVVDGKTYTQAQLDANLKRLRNSVKKLESEKKKFGPYGPNFGESAKSNATGEKFLELYNAAAAIKVTDFESAIQNYEAWQKVTDFVARNKNIRVAVNRKASVPSEGGYDTRGTIKVVVDPTQDPTFASFLKGSPVNARKLATQFAEEGVVETRIVTRGKNPNTATKSKRRVVTNEQELNRRNTILDRLGINKPAPVQDQTVETPAAQAPAGGQPATGGQATTTGAATVGRSPVSADAAERRALLQQQASAASAVTGVTTTGGGALTTTGGGGGGRGGRRTKEEKKTQAIVDWKPKFREMFPSQSWLLDLDQAKYPGLFALLESGVTNRVWETPEALTRFSAELDNTDFYTELRDKDTVRTIKSLVGDLGFDQTPFNKFLTQAANFGWEGDTLKSEVYKEAFRRDDAGNYVNPTAVARAKKSTDWLSAARIGKSYFNNISDKSIEQRLTGVITDEDLTRQQRELAKTRFSHLSNLIDQGLDMEEIAGSFRQQAAALLERDVNDIDMGSADFEAAYNYGEPGQKRMMTSGEWEILLRSDQKYGWDKTQNAKQEARGLASSIAQAFGRII